MKKQCEAINLSKPYAQCKRTDTTQFTMPNTGVVHESVCTKHIEQINNGKEITFVVDGEIRPNIAVIEDSISKTTINLNTKEEIVEEQLFHSGVMPVIEAGVAGVYRAKDHIVAGTGSRSLQTWDKARKDQVVNIVTAELTALKETYGNYLVVMSGMAEGFDKVLALIAIKLEIRLWCAVPNKGYGSYYWGQKSLTGRNMYEAFKAILSNAEKVIYVMEDIHDMPDGALYMQPGNRSTHANFIRNDYMVEVGDEFLVWDPSSTGTAQCFRSIQAAHKPFKLLNLEL